MKFRIGFVFACLLFPLILWPTYAAPQMDLLQIPIQQQTITPTLTIEPTQVMTVTVVVTATPTPITATATPQSTPLPDGVPLALAPVESEFLGVWPEIILAQIDYYYATGATFQGLLTHADIPSIGNPSPPDMVFTHPTDQLAAWVDFFDLPAQMSYALRLDTYEAGNGRGFIARLFVIIDGQTWSMAIDYGNQNRDEAWHVLD